MRAVWLTFGLLALGLGMVGAVLPLLPTVPFLLLATFCFARSSPRLHNWLITHPTYGHHIIDWRERGAISRRAKMLASYMIAATFTISLVLGVPLRVLMIQAVTLSLVLLFIWTRPD